MGLRPNQMYSHTHTNIRPAPIGREHRPTESEANGQANTVAQGEALRPGSSPQLGNDDGIVLA